MKSKREYLSYFLITVISLLPIGLEAKQNCQKQLDKVRSIQAKQRQGYTAKQGNKLQEKEAKARDKWWQCKNGKLKNKGKKKAKKTPKQVVKQNKIVKKNNLKKKSSKAARKRADPATVFNSSQPIVVRSRYQGELLYRWLAFYKMPKGCASPKSLNIFAYCMEDKQRQQTDFERSY